MNVFAWVLQAVLALIVGGHGWLFFTWSDAREAQMRERQGDMKPMGLTPTQLKSIGLLEFIAAVGLILPGILGVVPSVVPAAAVGSALLLAGAAGFHLGRGESRQVGTLVLFALVATFVAYVRLDVVPL